MVGFFISGSTMFLKEILAWCLALVHPPPLTILSRSFFRFPAGNKIRIADPFPDIAHRVHQPVRTGPLRIGADRGDGERSVLIAPKVGLFWQKLSSPTARGCLRFLRLRPSTGLPWANVFPPKDNNGKRSPSRFPSPGNRGIPCRR